MKMRKTILAISIALLLATLCGCMETNDNQTNQDGYESIGPVAQLWIRFNDNTNFKDEMINHIEKSKTMSEEDDERENYGVYYGYKFSEIKEFYSLDNLTIDGHKLFQVDVGEGGLVYYFATIEELDKEKDYWFLYDSDIKITIRRADYMVEGFDFNDPFKGVIEQAQEQRWEYLVEDGMFYSRGIIDALIGNTFFSISVTERLDSYEYLRDLAFKVIETAELVVVGE